LSGRLPFQGASVNELIQMQLTATPAPLGQLRPETPVEIEQLVSRMLAKEPADRPQSPREVAETFDQALAEAVTSDFETRLLVDSPSSGETTIERAREMSQQTTESISISEPPRKLEIEIVRDAPTTRPFTRELAAQRASGARLRLIYVSLIGLAVIATGYGLSRYVFNGEQRASEPGAAQTVQNAPTQTPAPTPTVGSAPTSAASASPPEKPPISTQPEVAQTPSVASRRLADQYFSQARELYLKNDYKAALSKTNEALKLNPRHRGALALRRKIRETIKILDAR
jgi:serine/threonine protein kinase